MKDFDKWNEIKKKVEGVSERILFNEGEIWWCDVGLNIGSEQDGPSPLFERPMFIAKKFSDRVMLAFPITSRCKVGNYYYKLDAHNTVILCQPKLIDAKRLKRFIRQLSRSQTKEITSKFKGLL